MKLMIFENRIQNRNKWCYFNSKVFHFCVAIEANKTKCRHGNVAVYILILSLTDPNLKQTLLNWMCIRICVFFFLFSSLSNRSSCILESNSCNGIKTRISSKIEQQTLSILSTFVYFRHFSLNLSATASHTRVRIPLYGFLM